MLQRAMTVGGGGGSNSITADTSNLLGSINTEGGSYITTEDCVLIGATIGNGSQTPVIYIDGNTLLTADSSTYMRYIGNATLGVGFAIPKGHTITTRSGGGFTYNLNFYGLAS